MAVFEKHHEEDIILEEIIKDSHGESLHDNDDDHNKSDEQTGLSNSPSTVLRYLSWFLDTAELIQKKAFFKKKQPW